MPHYNRYSSTKTKKSIRKKQEAISKSQNLKISGLFIHESNLPFGTVIESKYNYVIVFTEDKSVVEMCFSKTLPYNCNKVVYPGDIVYYEELSDRYIIKNIKERKNLLSKRKIDRTRKNQINAISQGIAANIDLAVIVVSSKSPPLHPNIIDRYIMLLENSNIDGIICLNKSDLKTKDDDEVVGLYLRLGFNVVETSTKNLNGIDELKRILKGKQVVFLGHSGVGKSSLTNCIMKNNFAQTGEVSVKSGKGKHTTTAAKYYLWDNNSSIIDTPGIRGLDVSNLLPNEIQYYFSEFDDFRSQCKYNNCLHFKEKEEDCKIKQAVSQHLINTKRYNNYVKILAESLKNNR